MSDKPSAMEYSVVVPVYNEEESLKPLLSEILQVMSPLSPYEIIFVDDRSLDQSASLLREFSRQLPDVVRIVAMPQRSGQTLAMRKGLDAAKGRFVVTLDADLQNDPADIPRLAEKMAEGYDCVCGWRKSRQDTWLKAAMSKSGNFVQRLFTGLKIHDVSCTLRLYKKECVSHIPLNWEGQHRFIPLCLSLQGYKVGEIVSNHRLRRFGTTKYSHKRVFRVAFDFIKILKVRGRQ